MVGGQLLAACGGDDDSSASTVSPTEPVTSTGSDVATVPSTGLSTVPSTTLPASGPVTGGTLRMAVGGAAVDSLDPGIAGTRQQWNAAANVLDPLVTFDFRTASLVPVLAESIEPNSDATAFTIRLREGVEFHDGRPLRADDVIYSFQRWVTGRMALFFQDLDIPNLRKVDDLTAEFPLTRARADLLDLLAIFSFVIPEGTEDFTTLVGTGPFRLEAFSPGQSVVLARNDSYWGQKAYLDGVELQTINDATARLNALKSGETDYATELDVATTRAELGNPSIEILRGGAANSTYYGFVMNVGISPFDNPDVRRAMRLGINRQELVDTLFFGQGTIGNDLPGMGFPGYNDQLPQQEYDPETARELFASAGVTSLAIRAAELEPGLVDSADLFAQQLRELGVDAAVEEVPADTYYDDFAALLATPLQAWADDNRPSAASLATTTGAYAALSLGGPTSEEYNALLASAQAAVDDAQRTEFFNQAQALLREQHGSIWWGYGEGITGQRAGVHDVQISGPWDALGGAWIE